MDSSMPVHFYEKPGVRIPIVVCQMRTERALLQLISNPHKTRTRALATKNYWYPGWESFYRYVDMGIVGLLRNSFDMRMWVLLAQWQPNGRLEVAVVQRGAEEISADFK